MPPLLLALATLCIVSFTCIGLVAHFGPAAELGRAELFFAIAILLVLLLWLARNDFSGR
jgi:hypothetical protein